MGGFLRVSRFLAILVLIGLCQGVPSVSFGQDDDEDMMSEYVSQFRENIDQARLILQGISKERKRSKRLRAKREAMERLSRAYIILERIPAKVQEEEDITESRRYMETQLKELGADPQIKKAKDNILAKAIQLYKAGNLSEALGLFEELRLMDPANKAVTFLVRHIGKKLDEDEQ